MKIQEFLSWLKEKQYCICSYDGYGGMFSCGWIPVEKDKLELLVREFELSKVKIEGRS